MILLASEPLYRQQPQSAAGRCGRLGKEANLPEKSDGLQRDFKLMGLPDYNAWEIVKRTNACLMEDPYWLRFSEDETFEDTTRGTLRLLPKKRFRGRSYCGTLSLAQRYCPSSLS